MALDLGGFGKGYALDEAAAVLAARGVSDALLDLGGQVLALGAPPGEPGWIVEVAHPADRSRPVLALCVRDASVSTSGNAERSFVVEGERFGHLLDPTTGRPVDFLGSVTVIAPRAAAADALSTALAVSREVEKRLPTGVEFLFLEPPREPGGAISARAPQAFAARVVESENVRWPWSD